MQALAWSEKFKNLQDLGFQERGARTSLMLEEGVNKILIVP